MFRKNHIIIGLILFAVIATGCQNKKPTVQIESSAGQYTYAADFPTALSGEMTRYTEDATRAREVYGGFATYPNGVSDPDWAVVAEVYRAADAEGRGYGYAARLEETRTVEAFFDEEKDDINRRVNGAVKNGAEKAECNCELDVYGKVSYALKESVEKRLEERLKASNQAFTIIDRHEKALGKKNVDTLEQQAADIALAAHVVYVEMPSIYTEVERRLDEVKTVQGTIDDEIANEKARRELEETSRAEKKKIDDNIKELENARSAIDIFEEEAKQLVDKALTEIDETRAAYDKAFNALMDDVEGRQKAAPAESKQTP